jgi:hypothetical protein
LQALLYGIEDVMEDLEVRRKKSKERDQIILIGNTQKALSKNSRCPFCVSAVLTAQSNFEISSSNFLTSRLPRHQSQEKLPDKFLVQSTKMPPKKATRPAQENISLGPQARDGTKYRFMIFVQKADFI